MTTVSLRNIRKNYEGSEVVHGVDLEIDHGEFIVLVGPSGCGKSTILRMIAGLEDISDGQILFGETVVNDILPRDRRVAMVFQNYALYPHMSVYENMSFGLRLSKKSKSEIAERVTAAARILNIENLLDRKPAQLSGGQRQRVAMGRAIVRNPDIFLFDEPLSNLDAKLRNRMRVEIKELHQRVQNTVIYVTHDQVEAMTLGDRIVVLRDGRIEQVGTPMELYNQPVNQFVAGFLGNPSMNLLDGTVVFSEGTPMISMAEGWLLSVPQNFRGLREGQRLVVGLRPDNISLAEPQQSYDEGTWVEGLVEVVEPLGNETHLHLNVADVKLTGICDGEQQIRPGQRCRLVCNLNKLHLFDKESGRSLLAE